MGKLRTEPKVPVMDPNRYREIYETVCEGQRMAADSHIFFDLDEDEDARQTKKDMLEVAAKEGIDLTIRRIRENNCLRLVYGNSAVLNRRVSASESRQRILEALTTANRPMKKSDLLARAGIPSSAWNAGVAALVREDKVIRSGERRNTVYQLNG